MKKTLLILIITLSCMPAIAQNVMTGKVYDKMTGAPVQHGIVVYVHLKYNQNGPTLIAENIDVSGNYTATNTNSDTIEIEATGYKSIILRIQPGTFNIGLEPLPLSLNSVVVTADRQDQRRTEAPVAISTLSYTTINDTKANHVDQLVNQIPGVYMADVGNEQHFMSIRQPISSTNYFLYLEDGIPIRPVGDFNTNGLLEINQGALQRIEVIKGPASSLYGSQAVGGTINFITMAPTVTPTARLQLEDGSLSYQHADLLLSNTYKKLGVFVSGYYADRKQADSLHDNYHKYAFDARADYTFNPKTKLITTVNYINYYTDQKGGLDSAHYYSKNYQSLQRFTYRNTEALRAKTNLVHAWNDRNTTSATLYFRDNSIGQNPFYDIATVKKEPFQATGQTNINTFTSYGAIIQHTLNYGFFKWITGASADYSPTTFKANYIEVYRNSAGVNTSYTSPDSTLINYKANLLNTAAYTQLEAAPTRHLKIVAGVRYDRLGYTFTNHLKPSNITGAPDTSNHFQQVTPKVGVTYNFPHNVGVYANYSVGFAPPEVTDIYGGFSVPNLKPSNFYNYEAGGWLAFLHNTGYAEVSVYQLDGVNEIIQVQQANGTALNQNAGKTRHKGIEAAVNYTVIKGLTLRIGGTYTQQKYVSDKVSSTVDYTGKYMADAPPVIMNAMLTYKPAFFKGFRISGEWESVSKYWVDPNNTNRYEGFNIFNARAGYVLPTTRLKGLEIWANCMNVGNTLYATLVTFKSLKNSYYPGMPRTFNVGVAYTFGR